MREHLLLWTLLYSQKKMRRLLDVRGQGQPRSVGCMQCNGVAAAAAQRCSRCCKLRFQRKLPPEQTVLQCISVSLWRGTTIVWQTTPE